MLVIQNQPHSALAHFRGEPVRRLARHGSILSGVGASGKPGALQLWRLRRIEAHRIAGLHRHCGAQGEDPEDFALDIERDVTLISGFNGAGKTALQNVAIWCLTGKALRSQHYA